MRVITVHGGVVDVHESVSRVEEVGARAVELDGVEVRADQLLCLHAIESDENTDPDDIEEREGWPDDDQPRDDVDDDE
jgi:hypothetical protein